MSRPATKSETRAPAEVAAAMELDRLLDEALRMTFPASDPISLCLEPIPKTVRLRIDYADPQDQIAM